MKLFLQGINYRKAPLEVRERFAVGSDRVESFLLQASRLPHVEELVGLFTCNRVELYGVSRHPRQAAQQLAAFLAEFQQQPKELLEEHGYYLQGEEAVIHGFRVASSLDSMILGEPQILGQVKEAYRLGLSAGTTGRLLNKYFHHALAAAKKVRCETAVGSHPVSVSYAAVTLAKQIFGELADKKALVIGAGKMNGLAMRHLKSAGIKNFFIANRTESRAQEMAREFGASVVPFENFDPWLSEADIVLTSTHASHYLIEREQVAHACRKRKGAPLFFIDLAVPRDVAPEVNELPDVFLYDIDDLGQVVEANREVRYQEAQRAEALIEREVQEFSRVLLSFDWIPTISSLSKKMERICSQELEKAFQRLPQLDAEGREVVEQMASAIVKKVLHDPMVSLKEEAPEKEPTSSVELVRRLFRLDEI